jgi:AraC-like DNA-binding protein
MKLQSVDIINIIVMFQLLVFIYFLLKRKLNRQSESAGQSNIILAIFLFVQLLIILDFECSHLGKDVIHLTPHLFFIGTPFIFLAAPLFYLYIRSLTFSDFRFCRRDLLHGVLFGLVILIFAQRFYFLSSGTKETIVTENNLFPIQFWIIYNIILFSQLLFYFLADIRILKYYRREIRQQYSSVSRINLSWLSFILYAFIIAWLSSILSFLSRNYFSKTYDQIQFVNFFAFFCFFNYIFYKGLSQPEIFSGIEEKPKYVSSRLTDTDAELFLSKLTAFMAKDKPYLNPTLTLKELALQISISPRYLSQIINEYTHQNFYDYISRYRIEEAKRLFSDNSAGKTVLEILYEVGFNSKSSFNTAFKKFTGITPSQFKRKTASLRSDS